MLPSHAGEPDIFYSCDDSLKALGTDHLDLYLLHWRGGVAACRFARPCAAWRSSWRRARSVRGELVEKGKIGAWSVSNFDTDDMEELWRIPEGRHCQAFREAAQTH